MSMPSAPVKVTSPNAARRPGSRRKVTSMARLVVDDDLALAQPRQGEAGLARVREHLLLGVEHGLGERRLAGHEAQARGAGAGKPFGLSASSTRSAPKR